MAAFVLAETHCGQKHTLLRNLGSSWVPASSLGYRGADARVGLVGVDRLQSLITASFQSPRSHLCYGQMQPMLAEYSLTLV